MTKQHAEEVLGLTGKYDAKILRSAHREKVKEYHPDNQPDQAAIDENTPLFIEAQDANEFLENYLAKNGGIAFAGSEPSPSWAASTATASSASRAGWPGSTASTWSYTTSTWSSSAASSSSNSGGSSTSTGTTSTWSSKTYSTGTTSGWNMGTTGFAGTTSTSWETTAKAASEPVSEEPPPAKSRFSAIDAVVDHFPYKIGLLVFAIAVHSLVTGRPPLSLLPTYDQAVASSEANFVALGFVLASFVNLFTGWMTKDLKRSVVWFVRMVTGRGELEKPLWKAVFLHLPYRLLFLGLAMGLYARAAAVGMSEWWEWPFYTLLFGAASLNCLFPAITTAIQSRITGKSMSELSEAFY